MKPETRRDLRDLLILWFLFITVWFWFANLPRYQQSRIVNWVNSWMP